MFFRNISPIYLLAYIIREIVFLLNCLMTVHWTTTIQTRKQFYSSKCFNIEASSILSTFAFFFCSTESARSSFNLKEIQIISFFISLPLIGVLEIVIRLLSIMEFPILNHVLHSSCQNSISLHRSSNFNKYSKLRSSSVGSCNSSICSLKLFIKPSNCYFYFIKSIYVFI